MEPIKNVIFHSPEELFLFIENDDVTQKQNRKLCLCKVPQYENKTKRIRNIMSETTFTGKHFSSQVNLHKQCAE